MCTIIIIIIIDCIYLCTSSVKQPIIQQVKAKVTWRVAKYWNPYSEFVLCIYPIQVHTHSSEHTHTVNTHTEQWAAAPGEQLGVWCLAKGHLSRGVEGGESAVHSLLPSTITAGPRLEPMTFG